MTLDVDRGAASEPSPVCPRCGHRVPRGSARCSTCHRAGVSAEGIAPWGVEELRERCPGPPRPQGVGTGTGASTGFVGCMTALLVLPGSGMLVAAAEAHNAASMVLLTALGLATIFGFPVARLVRFVRNRAQTKRASEAALRRRAAGVERVEIAACAEGSAKVRGRVRLLQPTVAPSGERVAAVETRESRGWDILARSRGGVFALDDGSGLCAEVHARWVRVLGASEGEELREVPEGAEVEVVADARWAASEVAGMRSQARSVVLSGTRDEPVLVRVTAPPRVRHPAGDGAAAGVRVALTGAEGESRAGFEAASPEEATREGDRRRA